MLSIIDKKGKDVIKPQEHIIGRTQDKEGNWTEDLRIQAAEKKSFEYAINISTRKRSGAALLKLSLKKSKDDELILWSLPVQIQ